jgi:hypothetical protein
VRSACGLKGRGGQVGGQRPICHDRIVDGEEASRQRRAVKVLGMSPAGRSHPLGNG